MRCCLDAFGREQEGYVCRITQINSQSRWIPCWSRASQPQRWLAQWQITSKSITTPGIVSAIITCPNCGIFKKSGRLSCCAPGGAWYNNCGGAGDKDAGHSWLEGVEACKRKSKTKYLDAILLAIDNHFPILFSFV